MAALLCTRRSLLLGGAALAGVGALPRVLLARTESSARFVLVILRGALDGLAAVPPHGDRDYVDARRGLALPEPGGDGAILDLDGTFGLHPALGPLLPLWQAGELALVHAVASPYRSRSHFDGQNVLENGTADPNGARDGWLNRALEVLGADDGMALAAEQGLPLVLQGSAPVGSWAPSLLPAAGDEFLHLVQGAYRDDPVLGRALDEGLKVRAMAAAHGDAMGGGAAGQAGPQALVMIAGAVGRMMAAPEGPRIVVTEATGWDTHANQGTTQGQLAARLGQLAAAVEALRDGLGPAWRQTVVVIATEFGRTVAMNGTRGTDHGTGGVVLLAGGAVAGGRAFGAWPGLAPPMLFQGRDLAPANDLRSVLKGVLRDHLGLAANDLDGRVFPESRAARALPGLVRAV